MVLEIITITFYFCWEISLCLGIGYRSPRYWHTEDFSTKLVNLRNKLHESKIQNRPSSEIDNLRNQLKNEQMKWNYTKKNDLLCKIEAEGLYSKTFNKLFRQRSQDSGVDNQRLKEHFSKVFWRKFCT